MLVLAVLGDQRLRRRRARRARPARDGADRSTEWRRFVVRRLFSMIVVLFAISILTFLIFQAIPNGDPARPHGRAALATPEKVAAIREDWGFDKPIYVQYLTTMKKIFTGKVISYTQQVNVVDEIKRDLPATLSLAIGAGIIWLGPGHRLRGAQRAHARAASPTASLTVLALIGVSTPVFFLGAVLLYFLGVQGRRSSRTAATSPLTQNPLAVVHAPDPAVDRAVGAVHRRLLARAALDDARHDERGLRAHGARQGPQRAPGAAPPRAAQLADPDRLAVGPGLRRGDRRRRDPHRVASSTCRASASTPPTSIQALDVPPVLVIMMFGAFFVVVLQRGHRHRLRRSSTRGSG